jgi:DNA-binding transcriptional LysR family regulator
MPRLSLTDLSAVLAVARHRSFRRAADELGLAPSTLSHNIRQIEETLGVRLFNRTTRSVAPTQACERLAERLSPALAEVDRALEEVDAFRGEPAGTVRINAPEAAVDLLLAHVVPVALERHPALAVDLVAEGRLVDIVAEGFDAGIRLGEAVPQDMVAVRFGGDERFVVVASPAYLQANSTPSVPDDLRSHSCIRHRFESGRIYRWEFERRGQELALDVPGRLTLDRIGAMIDAAEAGLGLAYVPARAAAPAIKRGALRIVLDDWCPRIPGLFLYYPGHRHPPPALRAFIDILKEILP